MKFIINLAFFLEAFGDILFKQQGKRTQAQANKKKAVTIGGTPEQTAYSQAKLKLMEVKQALKKKKEESLQGPKEQTPQKQEKNNKKENSLSDIARTKTIKDKFIPEI